LVLSSGLSAEPSSSSASAAPAQAISASELARLYEISTRLASLNERLRTELEASKRSSSALEDSLATSTLELATLRAELEASRRSLKALEDSVARSERESSGLKEALTRADDSLKSLEASFEAYKREAEGRIMALRAGRAGLVVLAAAGCFAAILTLALR
jgi:chromosome segregation ATPase